MKLRNVDQNGIQLFLDGWGPARSVGGVRAKPCEWVQVTDRRLGEAVRPGATPRYSFSTWPSAKNKNERALASAV
jgi:hypothetical protein